MKLKPEQRKVASTVIRVGKKMGASPKQIKAAIEAILVESNARHLDYGDRDSVGAFQQRPSQGWGPRGESVATDAAQFYRAAMKAGGGGSAGSLAQRVQRSAFPDRYDQRSADADAILRSLGGGGGASMSSGAPAGGAVNRAALAQYLLTGRQDTSLLAQAMQGASEPSSAPSESTGGSTPSKSPAALKELFYDPQGGWKDGKRIAAIGGHSNHVHVATKKKADVIKLGKLAQRMGLNVGENSYFTGKRETSGHAPNSNHYSDLAIDVSGDPKRMAKFARKVRRIYGTG